MFLNFSQVDSDLTAWLILDGKEYELSQFNISFGQGTDHKGQPQDEVRGGRMLATLTQTVPESLYEWGMRSTSKNGEINFRSKTASSPLRIHFMHAFCINFKRDIGFGGGLNTTLIISPEEIEINGISFDNHWVK